MPLVILLAYCPLQQRLEAVNVMDPLSVTASVVGLVLAADQVKSILLQLINGLNDPPNLTRNVMDEIHSITSVICSLQKFLPDEARASESRSRKGLIHVDHLIITLTGCVRTFSDLQKEISDLKSGDGMNALDRFKWARKEDIIIQILRRLQEHKSSLALMLNILQW